MAEYKKNTGFKKSFASRGASGPGRFSRPNNDGPREMFKAQCSNCKNECEVPFKPNGTKPVFCANCFKRDEDRDSRDSRDSRSSRDSYQKREYNAPRSFAPQSDDHRIDDLKRQMMTLDSKLDRVVQMLESSRKVSAPAPEMPAVEAKPVKKPAAKKVATKKAK